LKKAVLKEDSDFSLDEDEAVASIEEVDDSSDSDDFIERTHNKKP
jgi:hypothetical protein